MCGGLFACRSGGSITGIIGSRLSLRSRKKGENDARLAARRAAETLLAAHKANSVQALGPPDKPATISDAYDIQERYVALLRGEHGDAVGYKVGLTSAAMQTFCGIDHPIAGVVLAGACCDRARRVRRADYGRLGLEFEIAVRIKSDVPVTGVPLTAEAIAPHIGGVCAAIEIVDDRSADYCQPRCALAGGGQFLERRHRAVGICERHGPIWRAALGRATKDGVAIGEGHGRDILGHPFNSVAWLATQLASRGAGLKAGEVVMTGAVMKTVFPEADAQLSVRA